MPDLQPADDAAYEAEARAEARRAYPDNLADQEAFLHTALGASAEITPDDIAWARGVIACIEGKAP